MISLASARSSSDWDGFELFHQFVDPGAVRLDDLVVALGERAIAMHIRFQSHLLALERALIDLVDVGNREQVLRIQLLHSRVRMAECAQAHTTYDQQRDRENAQVQIKTGFDREIEHIQSTSEATRDGWHHYAYRHHLSEMNRRAALSGNG